MSNEGKQITTEEIEASRALLSLKNTISHLGPLSSRGINAHDLAILRNDFNQFQLLKDHLTPKEKGEIKILEMQARAHLGEKELGERE